MRTNHIPRSPILLTPVITPSRHQARIAEKMGQMEKGLEESLEGLHSEVYIYLFIYVAYTLSVHLPATLVVYAPCLNSMCCPSFAINVGRWRD